MSILRVDGLTRRFGGLVANNDITFAIPAHGVSAVIGPNGAGKTTLFSTLVGLLKPSTGSIRLEGREIAGMKPHRIASAGMVKTFQNVALFLDSSVLDNVLTGGLLRHSVSEARALARHCLAQVGLSDIADKRAGDLSFPERARVEVARALCTEPRILLLDEAMAALNHAEMDEFLALLRRLRDGGLTLVIVEHHMKAIMSICDRLLVLNFGRQIAIGTPAEIARDPAVIEAYLGRSAA